jgi:hypothetical protein
MMGRRREKKECYGEGKRRNMDVYIFFLWKSVLSYELNQLIQPCHLICKLSIVEEVPFWIHQPLPFVTLWYG